jgi:hypothetical protein
MDSLTFSKSLQNDCVHFAAKWGVNVDEQFTHGRLEQAVET